MVIVRVIAFWYQTQPMCIKWGKANDCHQSICYIYRVCQKKERHFKYICKAANN